MRPVIIAGNEETGEEYLAELLDDSPRGHDPTTNPIVRILRVVRYPNQRAIACPEVAMEFPPVAFGTILRMAALRQAEEAGQAGTKAAYDESLRAALAQAMADARSDAERAILTRHQSGDFRRKRVFVQFTNQNWLRIESAMGGTNNHAGLSAALPADHRAGEALQRGSALPPV